MGLWYAQVSLLPYLFGVFIFCLLHGCHLLDNSSEDQYVELPEKKQKEINVKFYYHLSHIVVRWYSMIIIIMIIIFVSFATSASSSMSLYSFGKSCNLQCNHSSSTFKTISISSNSDDRYFNRETPLAAIINGGHVWYKSIHILYRLFRPILIS